MFEKVQIELDFLEDKINSHEFYIALLIRNIRGNNIDNLKEEMVEKFSDLIENSDVIFDEKLIANLKEIAQEYEEKEN